jgi:hypothetical protein
MRSVWLQAAEDLEFEFTTPFRVNLLRRQVSAFGLLPEFGAERGMVVLLEYEKAECDALLESGYGFSCFSLTNEPYDRDSFVEILRDWGWSSSASLPPAWYLRPDS